MPKTVSPGEIAVPGVGNFIADAVPDLFDGRDLPYRPRLAPLLPRLDRRPDLHHEYVLQQKGQSCVGHAIATLVNIVLSLQNPPPPDEIEERLVSPYMLYHLARRYDEYEGAADAGSSLRGGFKGWYYHGVALRNEWPDLGVPSGLNLEASPFPDSCRERPLGAFYRVNPFRLDDMQSAISELQAVCVSAVVHEGWVSPVGVERDGAKMRVIARRSDDRALGGHAFVLVGYNDVGFLVQNSWGAGWGKGGFATLPYEDWLDSAYDAWVARPGVPKTPFATGRALTVVTGGGLATGAGPDLQRLAMHVVNLGNNGELSRNGKFVSTPAQVEGAIRHMERRHDAWQSEEVSAPRRVVLFAHGGLVSERDGLAVAWKHLDWWLGNRIYPITFAWQSGPAETLVDRLTDAASGHWPAGGLGFDLVEQFDRLVEKIARSSCRWMWDEMKQNARAASAPVSNGNAPGATLTVERLAGYARAHPDTEVHLVGHSAGAIFHAALLPRLAEYGVPVASLNLLAPAIRVDEFRRDILPHLGANVGRFAMYAMCDARERKDTVGVGGLKPYHKSLLYLVARALERSAPGDNGEVPLLGLERYFDRAESGGAGRTLREVIEDAGGQAFFAPSTTPADGRTGACSHGAFDDDTDTMTSVAMRILGAADPERVMPYVPHAPTGSSVLDVLRRYGYNRVE